MIQVENLGTNETLATVTSRSKESDGSNSKTQRTDSI